MSLQKNVASQKWRVFAFNVTDGTAKTGDAANITAKISKDWAAAAATNDVNPTETEDGFYNFDLTQAESNADALDIFPESSTADIAVIGVPGSQSTKIIQTGDSFARIGAPVGASISADVADVPTVSEFDARTLVAASYFDPAADDVAIVTTLTNKTGFSLAATGLDAIVSTATGMVEIAKAIWDRVLSGATHNITNSGGKRLRQLVESGNYALGLVWLDTNVANTGSTDFVDGTEVNPTSLIASVNTILTSLPLHGCHVASGSSVTLAAAQENQEWTGRNWTLALGGQSIAGSSIIDATVSGVSTGVPGTIVSCFLNASTFAGGDFIDCALGNTITLSGATGYHFFNCHHGEMSAPSTIDFGAAVGATEVHLHHWHGNLIILNMKAGDILHFTCADGALTLDATCVAGTANLAGTFTLTDNSSGMTINDIGRGTLLTIASEARLSELAAGNLPSDIDDILTDTANMQPKLGTPAGADISADIADLPTVSEFNARTLTAANIAKLSASVGTIVSAVAETGTLSSTQMTSDLSEATNDHFIGRIILWTSGPLVNQATDITDYVGTNGLLTFTEVTDVPVNGNTFIIV